LDDQTAYDRFVEVVKPKTHNAVVWLRDLRLMREKDGWTPQQILQIMDFAASDPFWQDNILSPKKLRLHADRLWRKIAKAQGSAGVLETERLRGKDWR